MHYILQVVCVALQFKNNFHFTFRPNFEMLRYMLYFYTSNIEQHHYNSCLFFILRYI